MLIDIMAKMKELGQENPLKIIEESLSSPKVDMPIFLRFAVDIGDKDFDPNTHKIGLIATLEDEDATFGQALARKGNVLASLVSYSELPSIISDPKVLRLELCTDVGILVASVGSEYAELAYPMSEHKDDEWDSPGYDSFWNPIEFAFQKMVERFERVGKKVKVIQRK